MNGKGLKIDIHVDDSQCRIQAEGSNRALGIALYDILMTIAKQSTTLEAVIRASCLEVLMHIGGPWDEEKH